MPIIRITCPEYALTAEQWESRWYRPGLIKDILDNDWLSTVADATSCQKDMVTKIAVERSCFA